MAELIEITLDGQRYRLRAEENAEMIREAAALVDEQLNEVRNTTKSSSPFQVALLGALNLALRLKKTSQDVDQFKHDTSNELKELIEVLQEEIKSVQPVISSAHH